MKYFIGISALHHDSAAALIDQDGNIINISQEERRTKVKNDKSWPQKSIDWCIRDAQAQGHDIEKKDIIFGYYEKPGLKFLRQAYANPSKIVDYFKEASIPEQKLSIYKAISHHKTHALAGCATAPFDSGVYLTVDAIGEWNTTTWGTFNHSTGIKQDGKINYPHSLGLLYSAFTRWLGLKPNEDEYIVMGAAAYGQPTKIKEIWPFIQIKKDGSFFLRKNIHNGVEQYLGYEVPVEDWYDWCASIQKVFEEVMSNLIYILTQKYGSNINLVLGGGGALNCVNNSSLLSFYGQQISNIWILPSPGDSGNALGAAAHAAGLNKLIWDGPFLGKDMDNFSVAGHSILREVVARLDKGEVVGWIQGREEFGPRALGHRSLLGDPRRLDMKDKINAIKQRQDFRPFAPAVLEEKAFSYFDMPRLPENHHFMQYTSRVRQPDQLPGIAHIDHTARVQTVPKSTDPFRRLLEHWDDATGCPVLLNTSLNIKGQPLISKRKDAMKMLLDTSMDCLVIGNRLYYKEHKPGLDEGQQVIANYKDFSDGADKLVQGRF